MARPQKDDADRRDVYVMVRLTKDEKSRVTQAAKSVMRSLSDYARIVLLKEIKKAQ